MPDEPVTKRDLAEALAAERAASNQRFDALDLRVEALGVGIRHDIREATNEVLTRMGLLSATMNKRFTDLDRRLAGPNPRKPAKRRRPLAD